METSSQLTRHYGHMAATTPDLMRPRPRILVRTPDGEWMTGRLVNLTMVAGRRCAVVHAKRWDRQGQPLTSVQLVPDGNYAFIPDEDYSEYDSTPMPRAAATST